MCSVKDHHIAIPHVCADVRACVCGEAEHLHAKPKRGTNTHTRRYLRFPFDSLAFVYQVRRTSDIGAIKVICFFSLHLSAATLLKRGGCRGPVSFQRSLYCGNKTKAELKVKLLQAVCWEKSVRGWRPKESRSNEAEICRAEWSFPLYTCVFILAADRLYGNKLPAPEKPVSLIIYHQSRLNPLIRDCSYVLAPFFLCVCV